MFKMEYNLIEIQKTAKDIITSASTRILAFYGEMGAGKTTLIKALVKELSSMDEVSSPTFGLVNEYADKDGKLLAYHFDFYRLNDENEALDIGLEDYFTTTDAWIFVEWPEKIPNLLPENITTLKIEILDSNKRSITLY